jgi:hypothetical protein
MRTKSVAPGAFAVALSLALLGCGSGDDYANNDRPPSPVVVTAAVTPNGVSLSPQRIGGGPISLIVTNLTDASHKVTIETEQLGGSSGGTRAETGPINPRDTAQLKIDVQPGTYAVRAEGQGQRVRPARLAVGPKRRSAQNKVLQP